MCRISLEYGLYNYSPIAHPWPGVGVTKAPFVNFSASKMFDLAKVPVRFFESLVKYKRDIPYLACVYTSLKNWENNGTEETGLVTPIPDPVH